MADLTAILGAPFIAPAPLSAPYTAAPEVQLQDAIRGAGIEPPDSVYLDGVLHRFSTAKGGSKANKNGWYIGYSDGVPAGVFGDWAMPDRSHNWRADIGRRLSAGEEIANLKRMEQAKKLRDAEREKTRADAAETVGNLWAQAQDAPADHPYLERKGVKPHGAKVTGDGRLMLPLFNADGELRSLQYIAHDGGKLYHTGGQTGACFWQIGSTDGAKTVYIAEGFATAATVHEAARKPCLVAFSAFNLAPVAVAARERFGALCEIVIVADNDESGAGEKGARKAAEKIGARIVMPPQTGDANDYAAAGGDVAGLLAPMASGDGWAIPMAQFVAQPEPVRWLIKGWLQAQALHMVHGMSGGGKTFAVLDMVLRIAADKPMAWMGCKVKPGAVFYLAGEGHSGLKARIKGWQHRHGVESLAAWITRDGCDLNTPQGLQKVVGAIRSNDMKPAIIVVDTLHRFLSGDENSAQDAKTMLDACAALMSEFNCAVLLVHHTGVNEEAQHRARGSSAWRGALDIEISVVPSKGDGAPLSIVQRKSKDAELAAPIFATLDSVAVPGWFDDEGAQVTTACLSEQVEPPAKGANKAEIKLHEHQTTMRGAWEHSGAEIVNGCPYITRSAAKDYLIQRLELTPATAKKYTAANSEGMLVQVLLQAEVIKEHEAGWLVTKPETAAAWVIDRQTASP